MQVNNTEIAIDLEVTVTSILDCMKNKRTSEFYVTDDAGKQGGVRLKRVANF